MKLHDRTRWWWRNRCPCLFVLCVVSTFWINITVNTNLLELRVFQSLRLQLVSTLRGNCNGCGTFDLLLFVTRSLVLWWYDRVRSKTPLSSFKVTVGVLMTLSHSYSSKIWEWFLQPFILLFYFLNYLQHIVINEKSRYHHTRIILCNSYKYQALVGFPSLTHL